MLGSATLHVHRRLIPLLSIVVTLTGAAGWWHLRQLGTSDDAPVLSAKLWPFVEGESEAVRAQRAKVEEAATWMAAIAEKDGIEDRDPNSLDAKTSRGPGSAYMQSH